MIDNICTDNRFEMIEKYLELLKQGTNIETSQEEMKVIENILFRFWQMGWLDKIEEAERRNRMNDLSFEFNSPMTKEDWDKLQDNEMEDTVEVTFKTPSGKRVPFRKVNHGEWAEDNYYVICSICDVHFNKCDNDTEWFNYCPNCGADMRGGDKNG